jgi:hypothetical protein
MTRTMRMAGLIVALATGLAQGPARATGQTESVKQQESQAKVQSSPAPKSRAPGPSRQGRRAPPRPNIAPANDCGDCFVSFQDASQPSTFITFCSPEALKHHRCCRPKGCNTCSGNIPQFLEGVAPTDSWKTDEPIPLPDRIITGPGAELIIQYKDPEGTFQKMNVLRGTEYYPKESLGVKEAVSMELHCKPTLPRPSEPR